MKRVPCRKHYWLITSTNLTASSPTIRVKCWLCFKRHRWPAHMRKHAHGFWTDGVKPSQLSKSE